MEKLEKLVVEISKEVEDFKFTLEFGGKYWHAEMEGLSCDGEEQYFSWNNCESLEEIYNKIQEDF